MPKKSRRQRSAVQRRGLAPPQPRPGVAAAEPSTATATVSPPAETASVAPVAPRPAVRLRVAGPARPGAPSRLADYSYVLREARRMGILAAALFIILAILGFVLK